MSNSKLHQMIWMLTLGLFVLDLAASSPVLKFPAFFDQSTPIKERKRSECKDEREDCHWIVEMNGGIEEIVDEYCQYWRLRGDPAVKACPKTCNFCGKAPAPPQPETAKPPVTSEPETEKPPVTPEPETDKPHVTPEPETDKPPATPEPETAKPPAPPSGLSGFEANCLEAHNEFRSIHDSPPLTWSAELASDAQKWAKHLANTNGFYHDPSLGDKEQGENLLWFSPPKPLCNGPKNEECVTCREMIKDWYDEEKDWDYNRGEGKPGAVVTHFTQVVWKDSKQLGMAAAVANNRLVAVARYTPKGNFGFPEDFKENVGFPSP